MKGVQGATRVPCTVPYAVGATEGCSTLRVECVLRRRAPWRPARQVGAPPVGIDAGPPSQLVQLEVRGQSFLLNQIRKMIIMVMICVAAEFSDQVGGAFGHRRRAKDWVPICLGNRSDGGHSCACVAVAGPLSDRVPCARLARTGPPEGPGFPLEDRDVPYSTSFHVKIAICATKLRQIRQVSGPTTRI